MKATRSCVSGSNLASHKYYVLPNEASVFKSLKDHKISFFSVHIPGKSRSDSGCRFLLAQRLVPLLPMFIVQLPGHLAPQALRQRFCMLLPVMFRAVADFKRHVQQLHKPLSTMRLFIYHVVPAHFVPKEWQARPEAIKLELKEKHTFNEKKKVGYIFPAMQFFVFPDNTPWQGPKFSRTFRSHIALNDAKNSDDLVKDLRDQINAHVEFKTGLFRSTS